MPVRRAAEDRLDNAPDQLMDLRRIVAHGIDHAATGLARTFLLSRSQATSNTLEELQAYAAYDMQSLFGDDPGLPERVEAKERRDLRGFRCTDLTFPSPHEVVSAPFRRLYDGAYQANDTVHARWVRHPDGRARATMVFLHSWMQPVSAFEDYFLLPRFAEALDVDVVSLQLPYHGRRKPAAAAFHGEYFWTADLVRTFEAMRQSVHDLRALMHWIEQQTGNPVGVMGVSLGGMVSLATACFEPKLAFCIATAAHLDLAGVLTDAGLLLPLREELQGHGWRPEDVEAYTRGLGLDEVMPCIDRERLLFVVGRYDEILSTHRCEALWRRWGEPPIHRFNGGHLGILTHMPGTLRVARGFLADLGLVETRA